MGAVREAMDRDKKLWEENNSRRKRATGDDDYCMERSLYRILGTRVFEVYLRWTKILKKGLKKNGGKRTQERIKLLKKGKCHPKKCSKRKFIKKLDGVGPINNRPSTTLSNFFQGYKTTNFSYYK